MPNMWQYESILVKSDDVRDSLNRYGKLGYQVIHIQERSSSDLFFILARDTGRPIDEGEHMDDSLLEVIGGGPGDSFGGG